jgi:hypothetical protein
LEGHLNSSKALQTAPPASPTAESAAVSEPEDTNDEEKPAFRSLTRRQRARNISDDSGDRALPLSWLQTIQSQAVETYVVQPHPVRGFRQWILRKKVRIFNE